MKKTHLITKNSGIYHVQLSTYYTTEERDEAIDLLKNHGVHEIEIKTSIRSADYYETKGAELVADSYELHTRLRAKALIRCIFLYLVNPYMRRGSLIAACKAMIREEEYRFANGRNI